MRGLREIDEERLSAHTIATGLNREGVPSPVGGEWGMSTINGNLTRRSGILHNEAAIGLLVFNRIQMVKEPETEKRLSRRTHPRSGRSWKRPICG